MKLIDLLLRLYPEEFRARFGREIRAFHEQRVRERRPRWARIVADHVTSALAEQMHSIGPDVRYALRGIARRPAFAAVVILTIALGVGANAAIFSVINAVLLRPLPYPRADRLVSFGHEPPQWLVSEPQYAEYRSYLRSFASLAAFTTGEGTLATAEDPERIATAQVTPDFFATLGVAPALGRTFAPGEDAVRPAAVVVLSHELWQRRFGGRAGIVGQTLTLNGLPRTVVGVMPERFDYPSRETQLWLPICSQRACTPFGQLTADSLDGWANHYLSLVGRIRPGASVARARAEAAGIARRIMREHPDNFDPATPLAPKIVAVRDQLVGPARPYLVALMGAVGFVLLIVCANVANLLLARGEGRRRELAVRLALGASRRRLATQLLTECGVFALAGGAAGLALAWGGSRVLVALAPASLPRLDEVRVDWIVVAFALAVSLLAALLFGVVPALRAAGEEPADSLRAAGKGSAQQARSGRARQVLVVAEVALAMVLLSGAGMLVRSLVHLHDSDVGFTPGGALTAKVSLDASRYDDARTQLFYSQVLERVRAVPGVRAAGAARWLPVVDAGGLWDIRVEGKTFPPAQGPVAVPQEVTPGYFAAMGMPVAAGRDFTEHDRAGAPPVAVVSRSFARRYWPGEDPLGRRFRLGGLDSAWVAVVGVVSDIRARGFTDEPEPTMYFPHAQAATSSYFVPRTMSLVVRTSGDPARVANPVRAAVRALDPMVPVSSVRTLEAVVGTATADRRFTTGLIAGFAALAMVLAGIGIYGVISYAVSERTFEIGVRMALGAEKGAVLALVMRDGARLALAGVALGAAGSVALARGIRSLLVGVPAVDVATLLAVGALLGAVAALASLLPARRATAVSPTEALRGGT
ncbi:MAG TPA: ABC transporter permease [Longimicrobium sp.]|jgi:putative ABC transport system permease protein